MARNSSFWSLGALCVASLAAGMACGPAWAATGVADAPETLCQRVVGVWPGEKHFAACVESLTRSAQRLGRGADTGAPGGETPTPGGARSYFEISRQTALARDRLACARLGFEPPGSGFDACVADLGAALTRASMPMM